MDLSKVIKFEPVDLTHIIVVTIVLLVVIFAFKTQLNSFFSSLQDRPITVQMSGAETTIMLDAPVQPELLTDSIRNPDDANNISNWEEEIRHIENFEMFAKSGMHDLYNKLAALGPNDLAVINFAVNDSTRHYFQDEAMQKYLSIASQKVKYLAFYESGEFKAAIRIQSVIAGLASGDDRYRNFGGRLKNGQWQVFPGLISRDSGFSKPPSVGELQLALSANSLEEVPFVEGNQLAGFLNYKSISDELYQQATTSQE